MVVGELAEAADLLDPRILEDGRIEVRRLLGLRVEPQARRDLLSDLRHDRVPHSPTMIIQPTPNLSVSMPKRGEKKVLISGCVT